MQIYPQYNQHAQCRTPKKKKTNLGDQDMVTSGNAHGNLVAFRAEDTRANSEHLGDVLLLDAALGEEDSRGGLGLGLNALDQHTVEEGGKVLDVAEDRLRDAHKDMSAYGVPELTGLAGPPGHGRNCQDGCVCHDG